MSEKKIATCTTWWCPFAYPSLRTVWAFRKSSVSTFSSSFLSGLTLLWPAMCVNYIWNFFKITQRYLGGLDCRYFFFSDTARAPQLFYFFTLVTISISGRNFTQGASLRVPSSWVGDLFKDPFLSGCVRDGRRRWTDKGNGGGGSGYINQNKLLKELRLGSESYALWTTIFI